LVLAINSFGQNEIIENRKEAYQIIPRPLHLTMLKGQFLVDSNTKIVGNEGLKVEGDHLCKLLGLATGKSLKYQSSGAAGNIILKLDSGIINNEAYKLSVTSNKITISGKTPTGVFYGIQTLRQLMPVEIERGKKLSSELLIPAVEIEDEPKFVYRGMHLDVGRHFFDTEFIKSYIDLLAMHKMNTFHWHLTEDQGWRIEIKKYPKLTEIGAWRKETLIGHLSEGDKPLMYDGKRYGGFYTQDEIREIVTYAQERHVTIIPEIDLPGHSLAAIAAYPELGATGEQYEVGTKWGIFPQIYAPTEETFTFLENVLTEVIDLFPGQYIHIGGDEALKDQWKESEFAQELIKEKGLKDEHELQSYFVGRIGEFLKSKGRLMIGWDEIIDGGLPPNATVMFWRSWLGTKEIVKAAKQHHNIIMTPASHCYFDNYQVSKRKRKQVPLAIGGYISTKKVYQMNLIPKGLSVDEQSYILGAQGNIWTEYISTTDHVEYMMLPRMTALSEVVWSEDENRSWRDFKKRLITIQNRYDAMELNYFGK
jgi:hexosaminidase